MRRLAALALLAAVLAPNAALADSLPLPEPAGDIPIPREAVADRPERARVSEVPGRVDDTERVDVLLAPNGDPAVVTLTQRLVLHGTGQFVVWERSSAQDVEALDDTTAPILKREAVIWQGFVNERKELAARLTLDPVIEKEVLPLAVGLEFTGGAVEPGGTLPGAGTFAVTVRNRTSRAMTLPTGTVAARDLAGPLDRLLNHAYAESPDAPPAAGRGLPKVLPATGTGTREVNVAVPFRLTGRVLVSGGTAVTPESGAVRHVENGVRVDGVLHGDVRFEVAAPAAGSRVTVELTAFPALDPRQLTPPHGESWADWLRRGPRPNEVADATETLVEAAAHAARADEYAPYLGHHGPGKVRTTFHFAMAPPEAVRAVRAPLTPRPFAIGLAAVALAGIVANGAVLWRRL